MPGKHYLRAEFPITKDKSPGIYDFWLSHLQPTLKELGVKELRIEIERLEPIDSIYTNFERPKEEIMRIFHDFAKSHHLTEKAAMTYEKERTTVKAKLPLKNLSKLLDDYNVLFDIFFADIILKTDKGLMIDMMDAFSNSCLIIGGQDQLEKFKAHLKKHMRGAKFSSVDHKDAGA